MNCPHIMDEWHKCSSLYAALTQYSVFKCTGITTTSLRRRLRSILSFTHINGKGTVKLCAFWLEEHVLGAGLQR